MNSQQITQKSSFSILSSPRRNNGRIVNLFAEFGLNLVCDTFPQPVGKVTRSSGRLRADALMFCSCSGFKPSSYRNSIEFLSQTKFTGCHYSLKSRNRKSMCSVRKTNENASLTAILLNSQSDLHPKFGCRTCSLTRFVSGLRFIFSLSLFIFFRVPTKAWSQVRCISLVKSKIGLLREITRKCKEQQRNAPPVLLLLECKKIFFFRNSMHHLLCNNVSCTTSGQKCCSAYRLHLSLHYKQMIPLVKKCKYTWNTHTNHFVSTFTAHIQVLGNCLF